MIIKTDGIYRPKLVSIHEFKIDRVCTWEDCLLVLANVATILWLLLIMFVNSVQ